jgi:protein-S-isoprenylcysteine O-methyltransferase Ste14
LGIQHCINWHQSHKFYTATEGIAIAVPRFLLLGISLIGILVYSIDPRLMKWSLLSLPFWMRWFGFFVGLFALLIFFWVLRSLGRNFSTTLTINKAQTLVTRGPYQWVRHRCTLACIPGSVFFFSLPAGSLG